MTKCNNLDRQRVYQNLVNLDGSSNRRPDADMEIQMLDKAVRDGVGTYSDAYEVYVNLWRDVAEVQTSNSPLASGAGAPLAVTNATRNLKMYRVARERFSELEALARPSDGDLKDVAKVATYGNRWDADTVLAARRIQRRLNVTFEEAVKLRTEPAVTDEEALVWSELRALKPEMTVADLRQAFCILGNRDRRILAGLVGIADREHLPCLDVFRMYSSTLLKSMELIADINRCDVKLADVAMLRDTIRSWDDYDAVDGMRAMFAVKEKSGLSLQTIVTYYRKLMHWNASLPGHSTPHGDHVSFYEVNHALLSQFGLK